MIRKLLIAMFSACVLAKAAEPVAPPKDFFSYGAMHMASISHWQHYLPPVDEFADWIGKDIANMKQVGLNSIALHVDWYDIEVAPGKFDFTRLDRMMDLAEQNGLRVLLWPWPELQPDWVARARPKSAWVAADGYKPGQACWDDPKVRGMIDRFIRKVVGRYKDRKGLLAWDVGAEAGIWMTSMGPVDQQPTTRLYCYCPHTVAKYRKWLERKYGRIGKLNEVWATYYRRFADIQPLRSGIFERAQIPWLDWRQFMLDNTTDFQRFKAEAARQTDAAHPITAHIGAWGGGYVYQCTDEVPIARNFDVFSLSFFPFWMERGLGKPDPCYQAIQLDGTRSASGGKPMWVEEMQGGPSIFGMSYRSRFPTADDIRLWTWQAIGHGASGVFFWNWRPETTGIEAGGFGMVNYDGSLTERARTAGQVARELNQHAERLLDSKPLPAQIAIVHDPRTLLLAHGDHDGGTYLFSERGIYRALWKAGLPVDFIVPEQLASIDLSRYKLIYLPFAYVLSRADARRLTDYVETGGTLFASLWVGFKDERTFVYETVPGAGLDRVFHIRQMEVNPAPQLPIKVTQADEAIASLPVGSELPTHRSQERFEVDAGGRVLAEFADKTPAIVAGGYGKGKTLYVGTLLPMAYEQTGNTNVNKLILDVAAWAGVKAPVKVRCDPADGQSEARVLADSKGNRLLVLINHDSKPVTVSAELPDGSSCQFSDLLTSKPIETETQRTNHTVTLALPPRGVRVVAVNRN